MCVCNKNHCDTVDPVTKVEYGYYAKYTSNKDGLRFEKETGHFVKTNKSENKIVVDIEDLVQKIHGFGGAFTDATGINIKSLDDDVRTKLMKWCLNFWILMCFNYAYYRSYFSEEGIEYSLWRVPMAATDFSTHPYSYQDQEDITLSNYILAPEDYELKVSIKRK